MHGVRLRFLCIPDVDKPIGGGKADLSSVEHLQRNHIDAAVVTENPNFRPSWFQSDAKTVSIEEANALGDFSSVGCILVVPETYLSVNFSSFRGFNLSYLPSCL